MKDEDSNKYQKRTKLFQTFMIGANTMLRRWSTLSHSSADELNQVDLAVEDVIKETETAVVKISDSFRTIMKKTRRQTELATGLLRHQAQPGAGGVEASLGLQDFIRMYEARLQTVTLQLERYSTLAEEMVTHQKRVREEAGAMDEVLDELRTMSARISKISLDASVAATNKDFDQTTFIAMTDRVRAISEQSHDLTRRARCGLDSIRTEVGTATKGIAKAAELSRASADNAAIEIEKLNVGMLDKEREIGTILRDINLLGGEIQFDIHQIIVAMQFQDLTQQKLEKVRAANLSTVRNSLAGMSHETRALMQRDLYRAIVSYSESSIRPGRQEPDTDVETGRDADAGAKDATAPVPPALGDNPPRGKIELF